MLPFEFHLVCVMFDYVNVLSEGIWSFLRLRCVGLCFCFNDICRGRILNLVIWLLSCMRCYAIKLNQILILRSPSKSQYTKCSKENVLLLDDWYPSVIHLL